MDAPMRRRLVRKTRAAESCRETTELIADYLNGRLAPAVKRAFTRHLRSCPDCVSFLETYHKTVTTTQSIPIEKIPPIIRKNVLDFLRKKIIRAGALLLAAAQILNWLTASYL